jgi:cytochrome c1
MLKQLLIVTAFAAAATAAVYVFVPQSAARSQEQPAEAQQAQRAARGEYLVSIAGCHDCHTPWKMTETGPEPDMSLALSGHPQDMPMPPVPELEMPWAWAGGATNTAFAGPWGVSFARNLTSDEMTGIGGWEEKMFVDAIRTGRHMGAGRPIMPPMPWTVYRNMTDEDLKSVFAYLKTVPAVRNEAPEWQPPAPVPGAERAAMPVLDAHVKELHAR